MKKLMITMMAAALLFGAADTFAQGFGVKVPSTCSTLQ